MFSSSFPPLLQLSFSQLPFWSLPLLPFLLSGPHAQPNVTLLLLPVRARAATFSCVSTAFLITAFQALQHYSVKCWRGWEKT